VEEEMQLQFPRAPNIKSNKRFRYSFICQGTTTRRQRSNLFGVESSYHLILPVYHLLLPV